MPDVSAQREGAVAQLGLDLPRLRSVAVEAQPPATRFNFRGGDEAAALAGTAFGVDLPREALRASVTGPRAALGLGPDEWLLIASDFAQDAACAGALQAQLEGALAGTPHSLVDISHRQGALAIEGRDAAPALNGGCPLDLSVAAFPVGMCTRTLFGKAEIVLWRTAPDRFHIEVWRSFTGYVAGLLAETCRDAAGGGERRRGGRARGRE